jgi:acyl carrier protein
MTRTQSRIAVIWQDLLGVAEIETNTDFFALGGHSLLAIRLIARVSEEFGCQINTADLFRLPTIEGLTAVVEGRLAKDAGVTSATPPPPAIAKPPFDCAAALSLRLVRAATGPSRGMVVGMPGLYGRSMETGVVAKALHDYDVWAFTLDIDGETLLKDDIGLSCAQEVARILLREDGWPLRALFGYSLGGFLAWLVDRLLVAAGREATPIVNLDGGAEHLRNSGWRASIDRLLPAGVQRAPAKMLLLCRAAPGQFVLPADAPAEWANAGVGPAVIPVCRESLNGTRRRGIESSTVPKTALSGARARETRCRRYLTQMTSTH